MTIQQPKAKRSLEHFYTSQFNWKFETHGSGAIMVATKQILEGKTVSFDCFKRGETSTDMIFQKTEFIGIAHDEDDGDMLRVSHCNDLFAHSTHSIIASWYGELVHNEALIAATIAMYLRCYSDFFLNETVSPV